MIVLDCDIKEFIAELYEFTRNDDEIEVKEIKYLMQAHTIDLPDLIRRDAVIPAVEELEHFGRGSMAYIKAAVDAIPSWIGEEK